MTAFQTRPAVPSRRRRPRATPRTRAHTGRAGATKTWKIAYADFVTAMMAFFLLLWLVQTTSPDERDAIAEMFAPIGTREPAGGGDGVLDGRSMFATPEGFAHGGDRGAALFMPPARPASDATDDVQEANDLRLARKAAREARLFTAVRRALVGAELPPGADHPQRPLTAVTRTERGPRVAIIDPFAPAMFAPGSPELTPAGQEAVMYFARALRSLPNRVIVEGHAPRALDRTGDRPDSAEVLRLTAARAAATAAALEAYGLEPGRIVAISGAGTNEPVAPNDLTSARNDRATIIIVPEPPVLPPDFSLRAPTGG